MFHIPCKMGNNCSDMKLNNIKLIDPAYLHITLKRNIQVHEYS